MVAWYKPDTKFFNVKPGANDNIEVLEYENGKKKTYLKDSTPTQTFSAQFLIHSHKEQIDFWTWWKNILLSGSDTVCLKNLLTMDGYREYFITSVPDMPEGSFPKICTIEVEEA